MLRMLKYALIASVAVGPLTGLALAQTTPDQDVVVVTGTRVADRSSLDTAVAVDVIPAEDLTKGGLPEVNQALSVNLPSFNFPRPALRDGTDTIRPAALRGLAPDQTLVLLNSKRRHAASLVNVNESIGRGSSAVDLNTIPGGAVQAIEVLRDGASAQYGSDAIAGVINVRLREANSGGAVSASYGYRDTTYEVPVVPPVAGLPITAPATLERDRQDGETTTLSGWIGLPLIDDRGFLTIAAEYKNQSHTERAGLDTRQQYPLVNGAFDPRESTINRLNAWTGEPELEQYTLFANAGYDLSDNLQLYGWASYQDRQAVSAGFFRRALDERNVIQIYPDGFLPKINPTVTDYSFAGGARFGLAGWDMDASVVYGDNKMEFTILDTLNRSIGPSSKTSFDAGGFEYDQLVFNLSGVRQFEVGLASPLNVAAGIEARNEGYQIFAGEPDSFRNGGVLLPIGAIGCTAPTPAQITAGGCATASGAQVFPGFRPENEVDADRDSIGVFVDFEANITDALLVSVAARYEDYSDFGDATTGKISARYDFSDMFALRASAQTGFRAPSPQQQFFATTSTNFIGGIPFDITTFPVTDPVAIALGAQPLDAEESVNYSIGAVFRLDRFNLTIDGYRIDVDDRIVLSENLTQDNVRAFLVSRGFVNAGGGRFFINGVNTQTEGVDIVANYDFPETGFGEFGLTFGANFSETKVTRIPAIPVLSALNPAPTLFGRVNVLTFERGSPDSKYTLSADWKYGPASALVRVVRYGEALYPNSRADGTLDVELSPETVLDLEGSWAFTDSLSLTIGADNVFDEYPDALPQPALLNGTSNTPYAPYSSFGTSGRFIYARVTYNF